LKTNLWFYNISYHNKNSQIENLNYYMLTKILVIKLSLFLTILTEMKIKI